MGYVAGVDRQQPVFLPEAIDDYVAAENPVRFLDAFVESLDLAALGFRRTTPAHTGRPAYAPGDLLRLYLYGYLNKIRSSRRLETETHRNVELMWLLRRLTPDFKTIADFRKDNLEAIRQVGREFVLLCKKLDLFGAELIAIDGSKLRAVNSKERNFTRGELERLLGEIDERLARYLAELDGHDETEVDVTRPSVEQLQAKIQTLQERRSRYEGYVEQLESSEAEQISLTDPESRRMKVRAALEVCYNVQIAVDEKHKLVVADDVTNDATDKDQLSPMALSAQQVLGAEDLDAVTDSGYYHGDEIKICIEAGISPYIPKPLTSANRKRGLFTKEDFHYDKEEDLYVCPAGEKLLFRFETTELGRRIRYYSTQACKRCPLKAQCTRNKAVRRITRWVDEHLLEEMEARLRERPELLQRRKELCEHPFGTMKRGMDQGYFLMKGLKKVRCEFSLTVLAYNLRRVINLMGVPKMIEALA